MLRFWFLSLIVLFFSLNSFCNFAVPENYKKEKQDESQGIKQINHIFWVNFLKDLSKNDYYLSPSEILSGNVDTSKPNIRIIGNLILRSPASAPKCLVRLPSSQINAINTETKEIIKINLKGKIGNKTLSTEFVTPDFDQSLMALFEIEGYIDSFSLKNGLPPGEYNYTDSLKLIVEFKD